MVGCIIVLENKIIGKGYHEKFGEAHAEVNAINSVKDKKLLKRSNVICQSRTFVFTLAKHHHV